eukprot:SAG31_NODE_3855_length_3815_cov_12.889128_1_plen_85_part_00
MLQFRHHSGVPGDLRHHRLHTGCQFSLPQSACEMFVIVVCVALALESETAYRNDDFICATTPGTCRGQCSDAFTHSCPDDELTR